MQINPLREYTTPRFPTREILDQHPELLKLVPKRWRGNTIVLTALAAACLLVMGCRQSRSGGSDKTSLVAPLFVHGSGRGSFGCKVINPPVVLSEDEARDVIVQEAKTAGIIFGHNRESVIPVTFPVRKTIRVPLDGTDGKRGISFEFISTNDNDEWWREEIRSTIRTYDLVKRAKALNEGFTHAKHPGTVAVFYDPLESPKRRYSPCTVAERDAYRAEGLKMEQEALRAQVRDFIKWLKAQGVI